MKDEIRTVLDRNGIPFPAELPERLEIYLRLLKEWNARMDLIAEAPDDEILDRHFTDSLTVLKTGLVPDGAWWIDVGTGAGFPGLPIWRSLGFSILPVGLRGTLLKMILRGRL